MAGAAGEHRQIAGADRYFMAARGFAPEHQLCLAASEAEDFVSRRMVVVEGVDSVAPLGLPSVFCQQQFDCGGRVWRAGREDAAVEQNGEAFVIGHPTVALEEERFWFAPGGP